MRKRLVKCFKDACNALTDARLEALEKEKELSLDECEEIMVDHLIAHGVTAQEWISVNDRLPTEEDAIDGGFVLANTEEKVIIALWSDVCRFNEFVTHWMPLPQPPKGE